MSSYENYTQTATNYDQTRSPVGVEIIVRCLSESPVSLEQQILLDAGCGTGNYAEAMLNYVRLVIAVDLNQAMLGQAREKLGPAYRNKQIEFYRSKIDELPIESETVDGIMVNQVLHHLNDQKEQNYPATSRVLREFARVLKPEGALVINTSSQEQLSKGFWYYDLIPDEVERMRERHVPLNDLQELLENNGFEYRRRVVPIDELMQGQAYFNARGPLEKSWRDGDSMWSTVSDKKLQQVLTYVTELKASNELDRYMQVHDTTRKHIGQLTFMHAQRKP